MENKVLIILGMHRSGTSLTANWLQTCGLNIGSRLLGPKYSNKNGHFEDSDFYNIQEAIFENHNIPYGGFENIENLCPDANEQKLLIDLIEKKNNTYLQWGWKDPRTCLFLKEYSKILPQANYLIVLRDYHQIIDSLLRRFYKPINDKIKNQRFGNIKYLKYKYTLRKEGIKKMSLYYENATIVYLSRLLELYNFVEKEKITCFKIDDLIKYDRKILEKLKLDFDLNYNPASQIYNPSFYTHKIKLYKPSKVNSERLTNLQKQLFKKSI